MIVPVTPGDPAIEIESAPGSRHAVRLRFTLPAGAYATVVVAAVTGPPPRR